MHAHCSYQKTVASARCFKYRILLLDLKWRMGESNRQPSAAGPALAKATRSSPHKERCSVNATLHLAFTSSNGGEGSAQTCPNAMAHELHRSNALPIRLYNTSFDRRPAFLKYLEGWITNYIFTRVRSFHEICSRVR